MPVSYYDKSVDQKLIALEREIQEATGRAYAHASRMAISQDKQIENLVLRFAKLEKAVLTNPRAYCSHCGRFS